MATERVQRSLQMPESKFEQVRRHLLVEYDPYWIHGFAKLLDQEYEQNRGELVDLVFDRAYLVSSKNDTATLGFWPIATETALSEIQPGAEGQAGHGRFRRFGLLTTRQQTDKGLVIDVPEICLVYSDTDSAPDSPPIDGSGPAAPMRQRVESVSSIAQRLRGPFARS